MTLHGAVHRKRPDTPMVFHIHHPAVSAVALTKEGFQPIDQYYYSLPPIVYHDFYGLSAWDTHLEKAVQTTARKYLKSFIWHF